MTVYGRYQNSSPFWCCLAPYSCPFSLRIGFVLPFGKIRCWIFNLSLMSITFRPCLYKTFLHRDVPLLSLASWCWNPEKTGEPLRFWGLSVTEATVILAHIEIITKAVRFYLNQNLWLFLFCMWGHWLSICDGWQENWCGNLGRSRPTPGSGQTLGKAIILRELGGQSEDTACMYL